MEAIKGRDELLDWIRAFAAAIVVFGHSCPPMARGGAVGVSMFFVLSGYLIASILVRDGMLTLGNIAKFIARRLARIYPMFLLAVVAACLLFWLRYPERLEKVLPALPRILTFTGSEPEWLGYSFGVLWTLFVEFWFYVTFPLVLLVSKAIGRTWPLLIVLAVISLTAKVIHIENAVLLYYDHFLIGAGLLAAIRNNAVPAFAKSRTALLVGLAMVLVAAVFPYPGSRNLVWYTQSLTAAVGTALIIASAHYQPIKLHMPAVAYLGRISYSVYLLHALLLDSSGSFGSNIPVFVAAVLVLASATYYAIEQPTIKLAHRYTRFSNASERRVLAAQG